MLENVRVAFKESGMEERGQEIVKEAREEIIDVNNEGVKLAQEGKLAEAIAYFEKAADKLPENKIINANAAQVLMLYMKENGSNEKQMREAKTYLDRVGKIDDSYIDLPMLLDMYRELIPE
jgi:tetratricopeptide (TPR) repeat protein